jgi:hypothetical protein
MFKNKQGKDVKVTGLFGGGTAVHNVDIKKNCSPKIMWTKDLPKEMFLELWGFTYFWNGYTNTYTYFFIHPSGGFVELCGSICGINLQQKTAFADKKNKGLHIGKKFRFEIEENKVGCDGELIIVNAYFEEL